MKIEDIPGFEKTPEIRTVDDARKVQDIAGLTWSEVYCKCDVVQIKKLLDDRLISIKVIFAIRHALRKTRYLEILAYCDNVLYEVTGRTWEELNES